jgi:dTDP-N-acetylfucosamine:lipid II N-acetylfucosaminyltransferase
MNKNLHLLIDVNQSNWYVEKCLKYAPECDDSFVTFSEGKKLQHQQVQCEKPEATAYDAWAQRLNNGEFNQVVINYFDYPAAELVSRLHNKNVAIIWVIWGADLYSLPHFWNRVYDPFAANFCGVSRMNHWRKMFRLWKRRLRHGMKDYKFLYGAMKKVTHGATLVEQDVAYLRRFFNRHAKQIPLSFSGIEDFVYASTSTENQKDNTIQIGNSGDPTNNHVEMLKLIGSLQVENRIFIPVAYGTKGYIDLLPPIAQSLFHNDQVVFQMEYMDKQRYFELLSTTGFAVMGHTRQQAFANIVALLYFGAKVFLRNRNPLLETFRSWGLIVFSVESDLNATALADPLSADDQAKNQEFISLHLNENRMREYYRDVMLTDRSR